MAKPITPPWSSFIHQPTPPVISPATFASYASAPHGPSGVLPTGQPQAPGTTYTDTYTDPNGYVHKRTIDGDSGTVIGDQVLNGPSPTGALPPLGGGAAGPTWYEQQQIALDKQRLADAEAQQEAARRLAESQSIEGFNKDFRDFQAKSFYGSQYGPTYFSPAGSVFAQRAPESATLKEAFANTGQPDPWQSNYGTPAGYTGSTYSNAQHPGLTDWGAPQLPFVPQTPQAQAPQAMPQAQMQTSQGSNQDLIAAIGAHPQANAYAMSLPGVKEAVQAQMAGGGQ